MTRKQRAALRKAYDRLEAGASRTQALLEYAGIAGDFPPDGLMEYKATPTEFKAAGDKGEYEGHFSVFGNVDDGGDIAEPGMFRKTLEERRNRVKVFYMHDWGKLIGPTPRTLEEDTIGLFAAGRLTLGSFWGGEAWALMKDDALNEGSFGFRTVKSDFDDDGRRHLYEVELYEISPVPLGMNAATSVQAIKAAALRELKSAIPPHETEINEDREADWDAGEVLKAVEGAEQLRMIHAWVDDDEDPDTRQAYALPHHDADGVVIWRGLVAAAAALQGARTRPGQGNRWPDEDVPAIRRHLAGHYEQFGETPPWEESGFNAEIVNLKYLLEAIKRDEALVTADPLRTKRLVDALDALVTDAQEWGAVEPTSKRHSALTRELELRARRAALELQLTTSDN